MCLKKINNVQKVKLQNDSFIDNRHIKCYLNKNANKQVNIADYKHRAPKYMK